MSILNNIIAWLKRIFTVQVGGLLVAVATLVFTILQYQQSRGGKFTPVFFDTPINRQFSSLIICSTDSTNKLPALEIAPSFKNTSKKVIKDVKVEYILKANYAIDSVFAIRPTSSYTVDKKYDFLSNEYTFTYIARVDRILPYDVTPQLVDTLSVIKFADDSLFYNASVESKLYFNAKTPMIHSSILSCCRIPDEYEWEDSPKSTAPLNSWIERCSTFLKSRIQGTVDILFAFHFKQEGDRRVGAAQLLRDLDAASLDSLSNNTLSNDYLLHHTYTGRDTSNKAIFSISWSDVFVGTIFLAFGVLLLLLSFSLESGFIGKTCGTLVSVSFFIASFDAYNSLFKHFSIIPTNTLSSLRWLDWIPITVFTACIGFLLFMIAVTVFDPIRKRLTLKKEDSDNLVVLLTCIIILAIGLWYVIEAHATF